jgi:hypothetical protein
MHILSAVPPTAADVEEERPARQLRESRSWFLPPEQIDAIRQAKFDLQALWRRELSDSKVLELFIAARFSEWVAGEKAAASAPAPAPRRGKKDKPGDEGSR